MPNREVSGILEKAFTKLHETVSVHCGGCVELLTDGGSPFRLIVTHKDHGVTALEMLMINCKPTVLVSGCIFPERSNVINPYNTAALVSALEEAAIDVLMTTNLMHDILAFSSALIDGDAIITDPDEIKKCAAEVDKAQIAIDIADLDTPPWDE